MPNAATSEPLGVLGVGNMGLGMIERLVGTGVAVVAYDPLPARREAATDAGATTADSPSDVVVRCRRIILSLPTPEASRLLATELSDGVPTATTALLIDCSTIGPEAARAFAERVSSVGLRYLDAAVSGGPSDCRAGTVTMMLAGSDADCTLAAPVVEIIANKRLRVGDRVGQAQAMKLINNLTGMGHYAIACEALALAERNGIGAELASEVLATGLARSLVLELAGKLILPHKFDYGFAMGLALKDLTLAADQLGGGKALPGMSVAAVTAWRIAHDTLGADADFTAFALSVERELGVTIGRSS